MPTLTPRPVRLILLSLFISSLLPGQGFGVFPPVSAGIWTKYSVVAVPNSADCLSDHVGPVVFTGSGLNDATSSGTYTATTAAATYTVIIDATGIPDTFKWKKNSGSFTLGVAASAGAHLLADGVSITFAASTAHTLADQWVITAGLGCWAVNGVTGAVKSAGLTQDLTLFQLPANGLVISPARLKTAVAFTGTTTSTATLGSATNNVFYLSAPYNLKTAVSATNYVGGLAPSTGSTTTAAVNVVLGLISTVENLDKVVDGSAVDVWVAWTTLP